MDVTATFDRAISDRQNASPRFHDATAEAGLGAPRRDPPLKLTNHLIADIWPGSGVAVLDFNGDGFEDLFVADGVRSILYKNDGHGHFTDVTPEARLAKADGSGIAATGVAAGDVDGDGWPDLFVTDAFGPARLFRNRGDGTFEETTSASGISVNGNARSAAFADVDGDGDLDLFVCVTGDYYNQMPDPPYDANDGKPNHLYINDGHGHFTDATAAWGLAKTTRWSLSSLFADYDGDGRPDLLVTNDFGLKNLYRNDGGRRFVDEAAKAGAQVRAYGMSAAIADFDGDGLLDLYTTGTDTQWYFLHDYPVAADRLPRPRVPADRDPLDGNDGDRQLAPSPETGPHLRGRDRPLGRRARRLELELRRGRPRQRLLARHLRDQRHVGRRPRPRPRARVLVAVARLLGRLRRRHEDLRPEGRRHRRHRTRPLLPKPLRRPGRAPLPTTSSKSAPSSKASTSKPTAAPSSPSTPTTTAPSTSTSAPSSPPKPSSSAARRPDEHFLRVKLRGTPGRDNRDGIGSRLTAVLPGGRRLILETGNASGYLSTGSPIAHLGLGPATRLESLTIRWPSGTLQNLGPIAPVDRTILVDEERGILPPDPAR